MIKGLHSLLWLFVGIIMTACGVNSTSSSKSTNSSIEGWWKKASSCDNLSNYSIMAHLEITSEEFNWWSAFSDSLDCNDERYILGMVTSDYKTSGDKIEITPTQTPEEYVLINTQQGITAANNQSFCDISDWARGVRRNKAGTVCHWTFSTGQSRYHGTGPSDDESEFGGTFFIKIVSGRLCLSEKEIDSTVDLNDCLTRL